MKNIKSPMIAVVLCTLSFFSYAQTPSMDWVNTFGGASDVNPQVCRLDNSGNVYTAGYFEGTADFDPGVGVFNLTSNGSADIYIQKQDTSGNFLWAINIGGTSFDLAYGMAFDANDNIHLTGYYWNTVDFDPGVGVANLTSVGSDDAYVLKLDPNGNFIWVKSFGGSSQERGYDIGVDASGNVYSTGSLFSWTADFDPGVGVFNLVINGSFCTYISKLDSNGDFVWAKEFQAGASYIYPSCMTIDASGSPVVGGRFTGSCDFDPGVGTNYIGASGQDGFIAKLDPLGNYVWAHAIGASGTDMVDGLDSDATHLYVTGNFQSTVDFNFGAGVNSSPSVGTDAFVLTTDASAGYQWHTTFGGSSSDFGKDVSASTSGNVYVSGWLNGLGVVRKWDNMGVLDWTITFADFNISLDVDQNDYAYSTGYFTGTKNFDPYNTGHMETSSGGRDAFVHKIVPMCVASSITADLASLPALTPSCSYADPVGLYPTATNNCGNQFTGTPNVTFPITTLGLTTITWSFDDGLGNTTIQNQDITVVDLNPVAVCMDAVVMLDIAGNATLLINQVENGSTDDCGIASTSLSQTAFNCADQGPNTVTYTVTDISGNTGTCLATITVVDDIDPMASSPATVFIDCSADIPVPDINVIIDETDNCAGPITVDFAMDVSDGQTCPETITRSYAVADWYGNTIFVSQLIVVNDITSPTASAPASIIVNCSGDVPAPDVLIINDEADNCTLSPVVSFVGDVSDGLSNPETITRTYSVADDCGNSITIVHIITVLDATPPTASNPIPLNVECIGDVPTPDPNVVTDEVDNCSSAIVAFVSEVSDGSSCPEAITRTYSVTDLAGNSILVTQTIIVNDITPPTASAPASATFECIGEVPAPDILEITNEVDNCSVNPIVSFEGDVSNGLSCPEVITRTYKVTDDCSNFIYITQTITVQDITPPVLNAAPVAINVDCIGDVPAMTNLFWTDNCDGIGTVSGADVSDGLTCPETITRTWSITDACGNSASTSQTITVFDQVAPVFNSPPMDVNVECAGNVPPMTTLAYTDNCLTSGTVTGSDVSDGLTCPETITRTWSTTDACGNTATSTQSIIINDVTPPSATGPAPDNHPCASCIDPPDVAVITNVSDNCTANPVVAFVSEVSDGLTNPETITRTYSVTDDCGNTIYIDQIMTITDTIAPVPNSALLGELLGECYIGAPTAPTAQDNCAGTVLGTPDVLFPITSIGLTVITWTYNDGNGNTTTQTQDAWNTPILFISTISNNANVLTSDEPNADYQWIDCDNGNAPIAGQISPSFVPGVNGNYAVQLSRNGCVEITPCMTINTIEIHELNADLIKVFPNPAHSKIEISSPYEIFNIQLINGFGAIVRETRFKEIIIEDLPTGIYFIQIETQQGIAHSKLIIE